MSSICRDVTIGDNVRFHAIPPPPLLSVVAYTDFMGSDAYTSDTKLPT